MEGGDELFFQHSRRLCRLRIVKSDLEVVDYLIRQSGILISLLAKLLAKSLKICLREYCNVLSGYTPINQERVYDFDYGVFSSGSGLVPGSSRFVLSAPGFFWPTSLGAGVSSSSSSSDDESGGELSGESLFRSMRGE